MKILDSSPIIAFYSELNKPELLHKFIELGDELKIPKSVFQEIEKGKTSTQLKLSIKERKIEVLEPLPEKEILSFKNRHPYLGKGEIEVILYGIKFNSKGIKYCCIIDDRKASKIAEKYKIIFTGVIGLIELLAEKKVISEEYKTEIMNQLRSSTFRMKK